MGSGQEMTERESATGLLVERTPPVLIVTIDRPPANAIDADTSRSMARIFSEFRDDPAYRVAVLTGAGAKFFSAGWDLKSAASGEEFEADFGVGGFGGFPELPGLTKPVICAVNGLAVGGAFEMVLAAHLVVAAEHAQFFLPEAGLGFIPDAGSVRLPRLLPRPLAVELLITGRRLSAGEAQTWGLVNRVVPGGDLMTAARALAGEVISAAPLAISAILDLIDGTAGMSVESGLRLMRSGAFESYEAMLASEDAREGPAAFVEERPPKWKGR